MAGPAGGLVLVGSSNPVKVGAVRAAVTRLFPALAPTLRVAGVEAPSGVPDQPVGDEETLAGALNRVAALRARGPVPADSPLLFVAVEGGVVWRPAAAGPSVPAQPAAAPPAARRELYCMAWAVVASAHSAGCVSRARSAEFLLPPALAELVEGGMELGCADDQVFGRVASGQSGGTIGKLSGGVVTRRDYYAHAVEMALVPFLNPELYGYPDIAGGGSREQ
ncbi:hypothetical protein Rsub_06884 [Raphidocelis subcapitata]|uniref:inosine/xanthosine triphosphatase n=1 Tax=Raphidocelis subcapitata TaxID=307507 RepID=A0A2V0P9V8_9CHLO|nr:hypothetical protein Rsub_06884 [Raphidocelis subcapitata]|eukprot:GBF93885.1 hypothetical protein Rsub_06884 [Raphidocelis subcapitata]